MPINILDILCFLPAILSIVFGASSGAVKLLIGFVFFILSIWLTYLIFPSFGEVLAKHFENEFMINFISIALAYVMSALFCAFIAKSLKKMSEDMNGGFLDRLLGTILGALRGVLLALIIFLIISVITGRTYEGAENIYDLVSKN